MFPGSGNFIKKFAEKGRRTHPSSPTNRRPESVSILDNKYVVVHEYQGRICLYDLEGKFIKMLKVDYMIMNCIALKHNKIALAAHVPYKGGRSKDLVTVYSGAGQVLKTFNLNGYLYGIFKLKETPAAELRLIRVKL